MFFIFNQFILFIKLFLFILLRLISVENTFSKICLIILLLSVLNILYKYPKMRFNKLSKLRQHRLNLIQRYRIFNLWDELYNIILLLIYFFCITGLIFYLRLLNKDKMLDLNYYYEILIELLAKSSILDLFCIGLAYGLILALYIMLMMRLMKYFKFQVIRRHLYFMNFETNSWYQSKLFFGFIYKIILIGPFSIESRCYKVIEFTYKYLFHLFRVKKDYGLNYDQLSYKEKTELCLKAPVDPDYFLIK